MLGVCAWVAGLMACLPGTSAVLFLATVLSAGLALGSQRHWDRTAWLTLAAGAGVGCAVLTSGLVRVEAVTHNPVTVLAQERAAVEVTGSVVSDPRLLPGRFGDQVLLRVEAHQVVGRGERHALATPLLVIGDDAWLGVDLGSEIVTTGRLVPADHDDVAGLLSGASPPTVLARANVWWRASGAVRASIRGSVDGRPADQRVLVPALVDGDDSGLDPGLEADFRTTGLTHLTAVSGTNLTLIVGFLLVLARWCRVRGRWLRVVGAVGIVGFVLLARTEPSVLRAAAMGTIGLLALGANGRQRAFRALGVAVVALLVVQPRLAVSAGFALSVLATAGIVVLAPGWRDAMAGWMPRWLAEAISVPAAAQLACTPVVAALSGQVSLVAVGANLLAAPAVGPATVLGLMAGLVGLVVDPLGRTFGTAASWCVAWVVLVARHGGGLPVAALDWGTGLVSLTLLTGLSLLLALAMPTLLRSARLTLALAALLVVATTVRLPVFGWPGDDWVMAMCDVGQGDALVLRAGPGSGVVVDAGPDAHAVDGCLRRLGIGRVPLLVLTHFHADHVDGVAGVVDGREVGQVWTSSLLDPPEGVDVVREAAGEEGLAPTLPAYGVTVRFGDVTLQPVWPRAGPAVDGPGDGSTANNASVVMVADVMGVRILLTGDVEPEGQAALARTLAGLDVDVLKVPHHGSRYQDLDWLTSLHAEVAIVSVGADNDYGHPAGAVLDALAGSGAEVARTDEDGDILVAVGGGEVGVRTSR